MVGPGRTREEKSIAEWTASNLLARRCAGRQGTRERVASSQKCANGSAEGRGPWRIEDGFLSTKKLCMCLYPRTEFKKWRMTGSRLHFPKSIVGINRCNHQLLYGLTPVSRVRIPRSPPYSLDRRETPPNRARNRKKSPKFRDSHPQSGLEKATR
jgi:hypothetical protein